MSAQPARAYYGIGEVLAQLSGEFPDVRISKIRFLESEGLIEPARSPSGYRRFSRHDVQRLRYILTAQRDHYLPLRVIKERLDSPDGCRGTGPARGRRCGPRRRPAQPGRAARRRPAWMRSGWTSSRNSAWSAGAGRQYGQDALAVARLVAELSAFGVQPRHLRAVKAAAERETSLIEQVVAPLMRPRSPGASERAGQTARDIAALSIRLHAALVEAELGEAGLG